MVVKTIGVWSAARISGALYAAIGLVFGVCLALVSTIGGGFARAAGGENAPAFLGAMFGVGSIVFLPILYGVLGLISGAVMAFFYNVFAAMVGGVEVDIQ